MLQATVNMFQSLVLTWMVVVVQDSKQQEQQHM